MNSGGTDSLRYCGDYARRLDEDRWLSAQYASHGLRERLLALYALHLEIIEIPAKVSEPTLGEIRLQWWREALAEIEAGGPVRAHPVIEALKTARVIDTRAREEFGAAIEARSRLFYAEPFAAIGDLAAWLRKSDAYLALLAARLAGLSPDFEEAVLDAGTAFALARSGGAYAPHLAEAIPPHVKGLQERSAEALRKAPVTATPAILHLSLTRNYLSRQGALSPIARRWRLFASMASGRL